MNSFKLWNTVKEVEIIDGPSDSIAKFASIKNTLFLLTTKFELYYGTLEDENEEESDHRQRITLKLYSDEKFRSIDSCENFLYVIDFEGRVFKFKDNLELVEEIILREEIKTCNHGCSTMNLKVKVAKLAVGGFGLLFVTENGELWGSGIMPQIDINNWEHPKRVKYFENRNTRAVNVGSDFAIVCVSKANLNEDTSSDLTDSDVYVPNCPKCVSNLSNSENSSLTCSYNDQNSEGGSINSKNDDSNHLNDKNYSPNEKTEKNIIFRNTEAARDFLTKQIMRMSSVSEEYFVECTEKPGKIIKENVTNMASLVYEGVKSLSKHVNGSFDNCNGIEKISDVSLSKLNVSDDLLLSVSQDISERDLSEHDIEERCRTLAKIGSNLVNCEVWTWGNVTHGQLGIGDSIKRKRPIIITKLSNVGVVNISVQNCHASALTLDGRAYLWGRNDYNQVTNGTNMDQSSPKLYLPDSKERIRDVSCGNFQTVAITTKSNLKYMGKHLKIAENEKDVNLHYDIQEKQYKTGAIQKEVLATSEYIIYNTRARPDFVMDFIAEEQEFLEQMLFIHSNLVKVISKNNAMFSNLSVYEKLAEYFIQLLHLIVTNVNSLLEFFRGMIDESEIIIFKYADEYIHSYQKYLNVINDFISLGGSHNVSQFIDNTSSFYKLRSGESNGQIIEKLICNALLAPNERLEFYLRLTEAFAKNYEEYNFDEITKKWNHLVQDQKAKYNLAEKTNEFWQNSGKTIQYLCTPSRRLIRESRTDPIQIQNAGRFSSHWIILLNDILVHVNGSTTRVHHLSTVWVESRAAEELYEENRISLKMPEQDLVLCTSDSQQKAEWLQAIENGIKVVLHKTSVIRAPTIRNAEYTFTKPGFYKDAKYSGRWSDGKMQGSGRLNWKDGRTYTGEMSNNQISGFGQMDTPNVGLYEGCWKNSQPNGFGTMKYLNGDVYKGTFQDGLPHGHGSLKHGSFMASAASIYIGEWLNGTKNGYGVMDDIVSGEKYLGTWTDNQKHGNGLMVTSDGVYYEGTFAQNIFCGNGLMILEDGTSYEGEFKGTGVLSGKGCLTLNSGHKIEGILNGSLSESIKISNGTLNLINHPNAEPTSIPTSFAKFCAPVEQKWKSLFKKCYQALGLYDNKPLDVQRLWQNIAISISHSYRDSLKLKDNDKHGLENSINDLDTIPNYGRTQIDFHNYQELKQYLQKAFENSHHPLGSLLMDLCVAYTTTYGGLHAHPLLLNHAVEELHSITKRLYEIINLLFPALPSYYDEITLTNDSQVINYRNILHPLLLPRVHSSLFILYTLHNKVQDVQYWKRLVEWNKYGDSVLLAFLAVNEKLLGGNNEHQLLVRSSIKDNTFLEAIETLQLLKTTFCPLEKLLIIRQTFEKMTEIVQAQLGQDYKWSMDDLFPAFLYVVVRARILQLGSEIHFIQDFVESSLDNGELGIMFTTLKACYQQILQEKTCINS